MQHSDTLSKNPRFQLKQGEEGLSVFDPSKVGPRDILRSLREGSQTVSKIVAMGGTVELYNALVFFND